MSEDQSAVIAFLRSGAGFAGGAPVEVIETHGAYVFLGGDVAIKVKRAVRYDYMDLSTLDRREAMLRRELELNRPAAPMIYRDVLPVVRTAGGALALGGAGRPVEWALRMWRFAAKDEMSAVAERGELTDALAERLGRAIHAYHAARPVRAADGGALIAAILDELDRVFSEMTDALGADGVAAFGAAARAALDRLAPILAARGQTGHVRRAHGDLHLHNLVLIDGAPVPFDALEFDETLGTCDVLYDLAFLLMDLWQRRLYRAANVTLTAYLLGAGGAEDAGVAALPLFLSVRAAIRAMTMVQTDRARHAGGSLTAKAQAHLDAALADLAPPAPCLLAVGGVSGTGKTVLARALAPLVGAVPGAVHLRSDTERKALTGVPPEAPLPASHYTPEARARVYDRMLDRACPLLGAGQAVILDATFLGGADRAEALARETGVPFRGLWLGADAARLAERLAGRAGDASDADAVVMRRQLARAAPPRGWQIVDAGGPPDETLERARAALGRVLARSDP